MLYKGYFRDIREDRLYRVEVVTHHDTTPAPELTLGPTPFVTEMSADDENLYAPTRLSSATLQIVGDPILTDMCAGQYTENTVALYEGNTNSALWRGYVRPNVWDAAFDHETETYEIECLDGLSVLQYLDYTPVAAQKDFQKLSRILRHILARETLYSNLYVMDTMKVTGLSDSPWESFTVSEAAFFEDDDESGEDKPLDCLTVLKEICKYMNVTAVAWKNDVWLLDWDQLKRSKGSYLRFIKYGLDPDTGDPDLPGTEMTLAAARYTVDKNSFASSGSTLTMTPVYKKYTVTDKLRAVDSIIPPMFENKNLRNIQGYPWSGKDGDGKNWNSTFSGYLRSYYIDSDDWVWDKKNYYCTYTERFYQNRLYSNKAGDLSGVTKLNNDTSTGGVASWPSVIADGTSTGVMFVKAVTENFETWYDYRIKNVHSVDFTDWMLIYMNDNSSENDVLMSTDKSRIDPFFMSWNARCIVSGTAKIFDARYAVMPLNDFKAEDDKASASDLYIPMSIRLGGWTARWAPRLTSTVSGYGRKPTWVKSAADEIMHVTLFNDMNISQFSVTVDHFLGQEISVWNTVTPEDNISDSGFVIGTPLTAEGSCIAAKPEIKIYGRGRVNSNYSMEKIWIKDFDIKFFVPQVDGRDSNDSDTEYTITINDFNADDDKTEFRLCTFDSKNCNYSAVAYPSGGDYKMVSDVNTPAASGLRPEEQYCYRVANQYSASRMRFQMNLLNGTLTPWTVVNIASVPGDFVVDKFGVDWGGGCITATLTEKAAAGELNWTRED